MARIVRYTFAGMLGAVIAWAIMEPTPAMPDEFGEVGAGWTFLLGIVCGGLIGLTLGLAQGLSTASPREARKSVVSGMLVGAGGGVLGLYFGNAIFSVFLGLAGGSAIYDSLRQQIPANASAQLPQPGLLTFFLLLIGRGSGWAFLGGFVGLAQGLATGSTKKMINGAIGGFIGGGMGGAVFEIMAWINLGRVVGFPPWFIRVVALAITGGCVGLFIGFIEEVTKKAWLIRLIGRNEGREYTIFKPMTVLGRSEMVDLPVFGDPDVAERHAAISAVGNRHYVEDMGSFAGTSVNGQRVKKEPLRDGDEIVVGKTRFLFRDKATAGYGAAGGGDPRPSIPTSQHVCPFCGSVKDAGGNCACTVGGSAPQQTAQQPAPTQQMPAPAAGVTISQAPSPSPPQAGEGWGEGGPRLTAMSGPYTGTVYGLKSGETLIGREAAKDVPLPQDNTVSRDHARIAQEVTCVVLYDLGSTNGTYVNGVRVSRHELANADVIQIGSTKFKYETGAA